MLLFASRPLGATLPDSAWAETFGNSLEDSVSFRFPAQQSLGVSPLLRHSLSAPWLRSVEVRTMVGSCRRTARTCSLREAQASRCASPGSRSASPPGIIPSQYDREGLPAESRCVPGRTRLAHHLAGAHERDAPHSSHRAPSGIRAQQHGSLVLVTPRLAMAPASSFLPFWSLTVSKRRSVRKDLHASFGGEC